MTDSENEEIYWEDLGKRKQQILKVIEKHPDPFLSTTEIVEHETVKSSKKTVLTHLDELQEMGIVDKKEVDTFLWWIADQTKVQPGQSTGIVSLIHQSFSTESKSRLEQLINKFALFGFTLCIFATFLIVGALSSAILSWKIPFFSTETSFIAGYVIGAIGVIFLFVKGVRVLLGVFRAGLQEYAK